jgi:hypothetical protein
MRRRQIKGKIMLKNFFAKQLILIIVLGLWTNAAAQVQTKTASKSKSSSFGNVEEVTAAKMKRYLEFIASDELEGRDTPSRGLDIAAMYIAEHLANWGVKPAGDNGTYFQKFPLRRNKVDALNTRLSLNNQPFTYGEDFLAPALTREVFRAATLFTSVTAGSSNQKILMRIRELMSKTKSSWSSTVYRRRNISGFAGKSRRRLDCPAALRTNERRESGYRFRNFQ